MTTTKLFPKKAKRHFNVMRLIHHDAELFDYLSPSSFFNGGAMLHPDNQGE